MGAGGGQTLGCTAQLHSAAHANTIVPARALVIDPVPRAFPICTLLRSAKHGWYTGRSVH